MANWSFRSNPLVHFCFAISFFTSGLVINLVQFLLFIFVKPINVWLYRYCMYYLCYSFYCQLVFIADWWSGCKLHVYASEEDWKTMGKTHGLLIMNHAYEIDWLLGWVFCEKIGVLGNCKAYAKKVISYIPTIGWSWKFAEFVFLERNFQKDKDIIGNQIRKILAYPHPGWLLLNAEGTRFTKQKHEASIKFAEERGITPLKYHLIPRTKGFTMSLPFLKGSCPSVYDINLAIRSRDSDKATIYNLLNGHGLDAYMFVKRYSIQDIPDEEEQSANWLHELFRQKDKMQESFHEHGDFFTGSGLKPIKPRVFQPRLSSLINTLVWNFLTISFTVYYMSKLLLSGKTLYFFIGIGILIAFYVLMHKSISMSKISKASNYGSSNSGSSPSKEKHNGNVIES